MFNYNLFVEAFLCTTVWIFLLMLFDSTRFFITKNPNTLKSMPNYLSCLTIFLVGFFVSHGLQRDPLTSLISQYIMLLHLNFTGYFIGLLKFNL